MVLETFSIAPTKSKALNLFYLLIIFLAWVSCCVVFGSTLMRLTYSPSPDAGGMNTVPSPLEFHWNYILRDGNTVTFSQFNEFTKNSAPLLETAGKSYIAFSVFAFIGLLFNLIYTTARILGIELPSSIFRTDASNNRKSLFFELILTIWSTWWLFMSVCVYGAQAYGVLNSLSEISDSSSFNPIINPADVKFPIKVHGTGYGYSIFCFLMCILFGIGIINYIRNDPQSHLGLIASPTMNDYNNSSNQQSSGESYSNDSTGQPAYQTDESNNL